MTTRADSAPAAAPTHWDGGWHLTAQRLASPNFGPRPVQASGVDLIVVHSISLPPGEYGGGAVQQLFTNTLDWDAHPCDQRAWHAGQSFYRGRSQCNDDSIGIELEGLEGLAFESAQYETLAWVCQDIAQRYPIEHIAGHEHIAPGRKLDPGPGFDWSRLQQALGWPAQRFPQGTQTGPQQLR